MMKLVTSDQFVAGLVAILAIKDRRRFWLTDTQLDERFQSAFSDLLDIEDNLGLRSNFSFHVDPYHGDSACLRDTLAAAKEKELVAFNNPTFRTFDIRLSAEDAEEYLIRNPLPRSILENMVDSHFQV
jgi:hypothetical protein